MLNICGLVVQTLPEQSAQVAEIIAAREGCEVHARDKGRLVVTVEDGAEERASEKIMALNHIDGVVGVTLSYHHFEPALN